MRPAAGNRYFVGDNHVYRVVVGARAHHLRGAVDWNIVRVLAPGLVVGSLIGPQIASAMPMRVLAFLVGAALSGPPDFACS